MNILELFEANFDLKEKVIGRQKYFNSAVLVSLCYIEGTLNFVFQKRSPNIRQGGEICFPGGGHEEQDKDFLETALRESEEELGISREKINILGKVGTLIIPTGVIVEAYLGFINIKSVEEFNINKDEVEKLIFIPFDFFLKTKPRVEKIGISSHPTYIEKGIKKIFPAKELNLPEMYHKPWTSKPRKVYFYFHDDEVIWGITADIILDVITKFKHIKKQLGETYE